MTFLQQKPCHAHGDISTHGLAENAQGDVDGNFGMTIEPTPTHIHVRQTENDHLKKDMLSCTNRTLVRKDTISELDENEE